MPRGSVHGDLRNHDRWPERSRNFFHIPKFWLSVGPITHNLPNFLPDSFQRCFGSGRALAFKGNMIYHRYGGTVFRDYI